MPERDGDRMYRIKSPLEEHERVVGESLSALPSRFPQVAPRPERRSRNPKALLLLAALGGIAAQALMARELVPTGVRIGAPGNYEHVLQQPPPRLSFI